MNLPKETEEQYMENYKTLMKETKDDISRWRDIPCSWVGSLGLVHWDNPEGWYGERSGRGVQEWKLMYTRGGSMLMYGKTNTVL